MNPHQPPRWAEYLIALLLPARTREHQLGDLREGFERRASSPEKARAWYRRQLLQTVGPAISMRVRDAFDNLGSIQPMIDPLRKDLLYAVRSLRKNPLFTLVATLTLALAIGVNSGIFSIVSQVVFADVPMQDPDDVLVLRGTNVAQGIEQGRLSLPDFLDYAEQQESFSALSATSPGSWVLTGLGQPQRLSGRHVTANLLRTWDLPPILGRDFTPDEGQLGAPSVALISEAFWSSQFGRDPDVLGQRIQLDGVDHTIIGVTDPRMQFAAFRGTDVWVPLRPEHDGVGRDLRALFVTARLAPGWTVPQAAEEAGRIAQRLSEEHPVTNSGWSIRALPVRESLIDSEGRLVVGMLLLTVSFVVLIACANVANMLLARSTTRAREIAVRRAMGASRGRIVRQLMTESLVISAISAALGVAFAFGLLEFLIYVSNGTEELFLMAELNTRVLLFTGAISLVTPLLFGLMPAIRASEHGTGSALRTARGADGGKRGRRTRATLVGAQIGLAMTLMIVAGLMTRSVSNLANRELGFDPAGGVAISLNLPEASYADADERVRFFEQAVEALNGIPELGDAGLTNTLPAAGLGLRRGVEIEGRPLPPGDARPPVRVVTVSPNYFDVLGTPLRSGRGLEASDDAEAPRVVLISQEMADAHWEGGDPVGRRIRVGLEEQDWLMVVGVISDVRGVLDDERPAPNIYVPFAQNAGTRSFIVARSRAGLEAVAADMRSAAWSVDPNLPIDRITSFEQAIQEDAASIFALISLFLIFAAFALFMAALGVYGVMSYTVSQRTAEMGLRLALGANRGDLRLMVLRQGGRVVAMGLLAGLAASLLLSRGMGSLMYELSATDPLTFGGVTAVLGVAALLANLIPAIRATRADPATALRGEL